MREHHRRALAYLFQQVDEWAYACEEAGRPVDRALAFAGESMHYALRVDPDGEDPDLMLMFDAAARYVATYREVVQAA